jgi:hypothetical protein
VTQLAEWWKNIPPAMKQHKQFMVSGTDKAPINPSTGYLAAKNDPRNWLKFGGRKRLVLGLGNPLR